MSQLLNKFLYGCIFMCRQEPIEKLPSTWNWRQLFYWFYSVVGKWL